MIGVTRTSRRELTLRFTVFEAGMPLIGLALTILGFVLLADRVA